MVNVIFGINTPVSKWLLTEKLSAQLHTYLRMLVACALFWLFSAFVKSEKVAPRDMALLFLCAFCGLAMNQFLFVSGLSMTSPVDASVIVTSTPIFVMVFSALVLKEPISVLKVTGVFSGAAGAVWLILSAGGGSGGGGSVLGDVLALSSSFIYSIYFVIAKPLSQKYSACTMMKWMFLFSVLILAPFCGPSLFDPASVKGAIDAKALAACAYVFVGATFLAYLLIPMAIKRIRPTTASMYNYLQPVVASVIAVFAMGSGFGAQKFAASLLIFLGVYLVTQSRARRDVGRDA